MPRLDLFYGFDGDGDACVYVRVIDDRGEHIRYCTESELRALFTSHVYEDGAIPEGMGICLACGGSCDDDGICEACDEEIDAVNQGAAPGEPQAASD